MGGSYEEKKTVPEVLTVAERARVVLKTTVFFPDRLFLNLFYVYCAKTVEFQVFFFF